MPKDPPIGRIGYVLEGFGDGKSVTGQSREIRCNGCRTWFDAHYYLCPDCDHPRPGFNKRIRSAQLDRHLAGYAGIANSQPNIAPITSNIDLPH
jgi:hypothetical protein